MGLVPLCDRGGLCIVPPGPLCIPRRCLKASQFGEPINSLNLIRVQQRDSQQNGIAKGSHRRAGAGGRPATVASGRCWPSTFLSERDSWCLESRASEGRFLPLHVRPDTASKCESFPGRDEVSRKPCSRGRDRGGQVSTTQPDAVSRLFRGTRPGVGGKPARRRRDRQSMSQPPCSPRFTVIESSSVREDRAACDPPHERFAPWDSQG